MNDYVAKNFLVNQEIYAYKSIVLIKIKLGLLLINYLKLKLLNIIKPMKDNGFQRLYLNKMFRQNHFAFQSFLGLFNFFNDNSCC